MTRNSIISRWRYIGNRQDTQWKRQRQEIPLSVGDVVSANDGAMLCGYICNLARGLENFVRYWCDLYCRQAVGDKSDHRDTNWPVVNQAYVIAKKSSGWSLCIWRVAILKKWPESFLSLQSSSWISLTGFTATNFVKIISADIMLEEHVAPWKFIRTIGL